MLHLECNNKDKYIVEICPTDRSFSVVTGGNSYFVKCVMLEENICSIRNEALIHIELQRLYVYREERLQTEEQIMGEKRYHRQE